MTTTITTKTTSRVVINSPIVETDVTVSNGPKGDAGAVGPVGPPGIGLPGGGIAGQALLKDSSADYDFRWASAVAVEGEFLLDDGTATTEGSYTTWPTGLDNFTSPTVAAMKTLPAETLVAGMFLQTRGYYTPGDGGGAIYKITVGTADEYGDHTMAGGFIAQLQRTIFYPAQFGVGQDGSGRTAAQNKNAVEAMIAAMNASTRPTAKWDGNWTVNGGWSRITAPGTTHTADGMGYITRANSGKIFWSPDVETIASEPIVPAPEFITISNIKIDGGWDGVNSLTQAAIALESDFSLVQNCQTFNSGGISIKGFRSRALFNDIWDVSGGGLSVGKSNATLCFGNSVRNSDGEGIQCDEGTDILIAGNYVSDCGGVGGFGANEVTGVLWAMNHAYQNNNGGIVNGNKGDVLSDYSGMIGNVLRDNGNRGIQLRAYYTTMPISGITRATVPTITFPELVVSAIDGTVTPVRITVTGHGQVSGNRRTIIGTPAISWFTAAGGFPKAFKVEVIDANTLALWEEDAYLETPVVGTGSWAAVGTSRLAHPFTRTGNPKFNREKLTFSGVVGMTEINGLSAYTQYNIATGVVSLYANANLNDFTGFDTSAFSAYVSGGTAEFGTVAGKMALIGNLIDSSPAAIRVANTTPAPELGHIILGNVANDEKIQTRAPVTMNNNLVTRFAGIRPNQNNVTGNGTEYTIPFANPDDRFDTQGAVSAGVFTAPTAGMFAFSGGVRMDGMGATVTAAQLSLVKLAALPASTELQRSSVNLVPNGGATSAGTWRATISDLIFLEAGQRVELRVQVTGLGADTADLVGNAGETFLNINGLG